MLSNRLSALSDSRKHKINVPILERPINKTRNAELSLSAFAFLFSEIVQYAQKRASGIPDLERRLGEIGHRVGVRMGELIFWREKPGRHETKYLQMLMFIHSTAWKALFGKQADTLERSTDDPDEYMISDNEPLVNKFISVPKDMSSLNCAAFVAGIIEAMLEGSQFPAKVTAHSTPIPGFPLRTTFLIKFDASVMEREKALS